MAPVSRLEVNLSAIAHNLGVVKRACALGDDDPAAPPVQVCAVLKADAYGLGASRIAKRLEIAGVDMIAVYTADEARALLTSIVRTPLLILSPLRDLERGDALYRAATTGRLHLTVHDAAQLDALIWLAERFGLILPLHLEVNTGMSRGGVAIEEAPRLLQRIHDRRRLRLAGLSTQFACARDDAAFTDEQANRFFELVEEVDLLIPDDCLLHAANSFATFRSVEHHLDMVRVGLALFGYVAEELAGADDPALLDLARQLVPAVRWTTSVAHIARIPQGQCVGYGATWRAERDSRIALAPVGYADGYPMTLANRGVVRVRMSEEDGQWREAPVVGAVSMDQITIDATDLPEDVAQVGAEVELVGCDRDASNHLPALAAQAQTISHQLLCSVGPRVKRVYISGEASDPAALHTSIPA
ncbi:MAG: alanine racemase, partial [Planctomycetota bacterium]